MEEVHYCNDPANVHVFPGARGAIEQLKTAGFRVIVITNQSGIGRGRITPEQYRAVEAEFLRQIGPESIDATYFCPDIPEADSARRKPSPTMVFEAAADHRIDLTRSFFVGDKAIDVECGRNAGVRTIQVMTGYGAAQTGCAADYTAKDVVAAVALILRHSGG